MKLMIFLILFVVSFLVGPVWDVPSKSEQMERIQEKVALRRQVNPFLSTSILRESRSKVRENILKRLNKRRV